MARNKRSERLALIVAVCMLTAAAHAQKQELRYNVGPGATVSIVNPFGPIVIRPSAGRQVVVLTTARSEKVEVTGAQSGNRVEVRSRMEQGLSPALGTVEFEVLVPQDAGVSVRSGNGPVLAERLRGDITLEGDDAAIEVRDLARAHLQVRTVSGHITLHNVTQGHVEITSVGGDVRLLGVTGAKVTVNTNKGSIHYTGNFGGGGHYTLTNHSGDIEITIPENASIDVTARSVRGTVENTYPLKPREAEAAATPAAQRSAFSGISQAGSSSVNLQSFSGRIRVKPQ